MMTHHKATFRWVLYCQSLTVLGQAPFRGVFQEQTVCKSEIQVLWSYGSKEDHSEKCFSANTILDHALNEHLKCRPRQCQSTAGTSPGPQWGTRLWFRPTASHVTEVCFHLLHRLAGIAHSFYSVILDQEPPELPRVALHLLCCQDTPWTCDPPASASEVGLQLRAYVTKAGHRSEYFYRLIFVIFNLCVYGGGVHAQVPTAVRSIGSQEL